MKTKYISRAQEDALRNLLLCLITIRLPVAAETGAAFPHCPECGSPVAPETDYLWRCYAPACDWIGDRNETRYDAATGVFWQIVTQDGFGRILVDNAAGYPWFLDSEPPAYRTLPLRTVARAVALGRLLLREGPQFVLPALDARSHALRDGKPSEDARKEVVYV